MAESAGGLSVWDEGASLTRNTPCLMCSLTHSHAHSLACTLTHSHAHSLTHSLTCSLTRMLTYSLTHSLTQAHTRTHVGTHTVKYMNIYNSLTHKNNTSIRSKNMYLMVLSTETVYSLQKLKCFALSSQALPLTYRLSFQIPARLVWVTASAISLFSLKYGTWVSNISFKQIVWICVNPPSPQPFILEGCQRKAVNLSCSK